jgi:hypothetical protein
MKPILVYANWHEVQYIDYSPKISFRETKAFPPFPEYQPILFGCSGLLSRERRYARNLFNVSCIFYKNKTLQLAGSLIFENIYSFHSDVPVHDKYKVFAIRELHPDAVFVDMESGILAEQIPNLQVIRYAIDRCDKRMYPPVINYFWRKYQHHKMQFYMENYLKGLL